MRSKNFHLQIGNKFFFDINAVILDKKYFSLLTIKCDL